MCTSNERITNRNQVVTVVQRIVKFLHDEEDAGVRFQSVTEHSPYTEFGKAVLHFNGDGCDLKAMRESIDRIVDRALKENIASELTATVSDTDIRWITKVTFEFVF